MAPAAKLRRYGSAGITSCAVVEVSFAAQIGAPAGEKVRILPLYLFPYRLPLYRMIVQGDLRPYLLLAGVGIQHMAFAVK